MIRFLITFLALGGLVISFYFTFAYYGRVKKARWIPEILCAPEGSSCLAVVRTPYARVLGVPNSLLGSLYYLLLIGWCLFGWTVWVAWDGRALPLFLVTLRPLILLSALTVALGFYLIYALRRKLHTDCPLCYTAHAINAVLLVLLILLL